MDLIVRDVLVVAYVFECGCKDYFWSTEVVGCLKHDEVYASMRLLGGEPDFYVL